MWTATHFMVRQSCLFSTCLLTNILEGTKLIMFTSICRMESIARYGWNHLRALPSLHLFILLLRKWKLRPSLTSLWWIRQDLSNSTYMLLEFYLWEFSAASQSLWCFVGKQTSNLCSGHLSLSFTPWFCYTYVYPITVNKSFVTTLWVLLFYLLYLPVYMYSIL